MSTLDEEISRHEHVRRVASEVSIEDIMGSELPEDLRSELLVWKLFDTPHLGTA